MQINALNLIVNRINSASKPGLPPEPALALTTDDNTVSLTTDNGSNILTSE